MSVQDTDPPKGRALVALMALAWPACVPGIDSAFIPAQEGTFVFAAVLRGDEVVDTAKIGKKGPMREGDELVTFTLRPDQFFRVDGGQIEEWLDQVEVRPASESPTGSACAECLAGVSVAPQMIQAGSSCAPPPFVEAKHMRLEGGALTDLGEAARIEVARRGVRLDWPGECGCSGDPIEPAGPELDDHRCALWPPEPNWSTDWVDELSDGSIALLSEWNLLLHRPDGTSRARELPFRFEKAARVAAPDSDSTDVIVFDGEQSLFRLPVDSDAPAIPIAVSGLPQGTKIQEISREGPVLNILGIRTVGFGGQEPVFASCTIEGGSASCRSEDFDVDSCPLVDDQPEPAFFLSLGDGQAAVIGARGALFYRPREGGTWRCQTGRQDFEEHPGGLVIIRGAAELDGNLYACGRIGRDGDVPLFLARSRVGTLTTERLDAEPFPLELMHLASKGGSGCEMTVTPDGRLFVVSSSGEHLWVSDPGGPNPSIEVLSDAGPVAIPRSIRTFVALRDGRTLYLTSDGAGFVLSSTTSAPRQLFGSEQYDPSSVNAVLPLGERRYLAFFGQRALEVNVGASCEDSSSALVDVAGLADESGAWIEAAVKGDSLLWVIERSDTSRRVRGIDWARREVVEEHPLVLDATQLQGLVSLPGDVLVGVTKELDAFWWSRQGSGLLDVEFGTPFSFSGLSPDPGSPKDPVQWESVGAGHGVAWLVGQQAMARVSPAGPNGEAPQAEGLLLSRLPQEASSFDAELYKPLTLEMVVGRCAEDALFPFVVYPAEGSPLPRVLGSFELRPAQKGCGGPASDSSTPVLCLDPLDFRGRFETGDFDAGPTVGPPDNFTIVTMGSVWRADGWFRHLVERRSSAGGTDHVLIGGSFRKLVAYFER